MNSGQTLHDFVLTLLSDPDARSAFQLDPEGALHDAGLSDITAVDVQDVIPLVVDYAPADGLTDLDTAQLGPPPRPPGTRLACRSAPSCRARRRSGRRGTSG